MLRKLAFSITAVTFLTVAASAAEQPSQEDLETVVVTGEVPGPGLWKVTKGDHVMWVLASYSLPNGLTWRSEQIDARIGESQVVLYAPKVRVGPNIGMVRGFSLMGTAKKAARLPDGKTLKDVLPPEDYSRWLVLREKYMGAMDDVEKLRPEAALAQLRDYASRKHGVQDGPSVARVVFDARKKHKVTPVLLPAVVRTFEVKNARAMLEGAQKVQNPDLECFRKNLDRVEPDLERVKVLANAWSLGDTEKLRSTFRQLSLRDAIKEDGCVVGRFGPAVMNIDDLMSTMPSADVADLKKMLEDALWHEEQAMLQAQLDWLAAAQAQLAKNQSTFAVLSLAEVLSPDGHLEKLRALGYTVEEPR